MTEVMPTKPPRRWLRIVFILSMAMNLLIVGLVAGALMRFDKSHGRHIDRVSMGLTSYIRALPEADRTLVRGAAGDHARSRKDFLKALRKRQKALDTVLMAEPFSPEAVRQTFSDHRAFAISGSQDLQEAFVTVLEKMSPQERADYFARVAEIQAERKKRRGKKWRRD